MDTTPYETQEEALEGRIRSMGYYVGLVEALGLSLAAVRETITQMESSEFPKEYGLLEPVKQLEISATLQVEPRIAAFLKAYNDLINPEPEPVAPQEAP